MNKKENSCGIILFRTPQKKEVLIVQQQNGDWGFPKGHIEYNETVEETALRELQEEVGITDVSIDTEAGTIHVSYVFDSKE